MVEYLLSNAFSLFIRAAIPILLGLLAGGGAAALIQLLLHTEERAIGFFGRYIGAAAGAYFAFVLSGNTLLRYAERLWGGLDLYR